jgi:hypothetical protein
MDLRLRIVREIVPEISSNLHGTWTAPKPLRQRADHVRCRHFLALKLSNIELHFLSAEVAVVLHNMSPRDAEDTGQQPGEDTPLLLQPPEEENWKPPRGFFWIELTIFANVFLYGFDSTITAATYAVISSEFDAANTASWLTTSYLVTSTAFQPLYGRLSDIFGRRVCFFVSTITFAAGCLGCGLANNMLVVNLMRALTGFGGGGLMTMGNEYPCG